MIKVVSLSNIDVLLKNKRPRRLTSLLGLYSGGHCADYIGENCSMPTGTDVAGLDALRIVRTRSERAAHASAEGTVPFSFIHNMRAPWVG